MGRAAAANSAPGQMLCHLPDATPPPWSSWQTAAPPPPRLSSRVFCSLGPPEPREEESALPCLSPQETTGTSLVPSLP